MTRCLALALAALCSCQLNRDPPKEPELQLRSYKVPPASAPQLRAVIHGALFLEKDKSVGRVSVSPDGQLVVLGTPAIQLGVQELIKDYGSHPPPPSLELTYWLVRGKPAPSGSKPTPSPELAELQAALAAVPGAPLQYELVERLRLASLADERAHVSGRALHVEQSASLIGDKVVAELKLHPRSRPSNSVETRVQLVPGQLLVLAEAGVGEDQGQVLYLVRASVLGAR